MKAAFSAIRASGVAVAEQRFLRKRAVDALMGSKSEADKGLIQIHDQMHREAAMALEVTTVGKARLRAELARRGQGSLAKRVDTLTSARRAAARLDVDLPRAVGEALSRPCVFHAALDTDCDIEMELEECAESEPPVRRRMRSPRRRQAARTLPCCTWTCRRSRCG